MLLRPGMTATADIKVAEVKDTLAISNAALRFSPPVTAENGGGSGLLGVIFRPPTRQASTVAQASTDGSRDIWLLKNGQAVAAVR